MELCFSMITTTQLQITQTYVVLTNGLWYQRNTALHIIRYKMIR